MTDLAKGWSWRKDEHSISKNRSGGRTVDIARVVRTVLPVNVAASVGSSIGNELHALTLDQLEARRRRAQGLPEMERRIYFQTIGKGSVATTTLVAIFLALRAERRRALWAFAIAVLLTTLVGDRFDRMLLHRIPLKETQF
jgi:hypothetical protein